MFSHLFFLYLGPPFISKIIFLGKSERVLRSVSSLPSAKELLVLILNTILILVDNTLLVLLCFDLLCIFIKLEVDLHVFAQLAWLPSLTGNFSLSFQLCFDSQYIMGAFKKKKASSTSEVIQKYYCDTKKYYCRTKTTHLKGSNFSYKV